MTELFLRTAKLTVGPSPNGPVVLLPKTFEGFRITFEIEKTPDISPNPAKIALYNLAPSSRSYLDQPPMSLQCVLEVGYLGTSGSALTSVIFTGDIRRPITARNGADIVTTIECGDAEVALRTTTYDGAVGPGSPVSGLIGLLAGKLGVTVGTIDPSLSGVFQHGASFSGLVSDHLDVLTKAAGLECHVTDGELNILKPGTATADPPVLVSVDTGLIGYPSKRVEAIIDFTSLLNPLIKPGRAIQLESETINITTVARTCRYKGDTHGGDWTVSVEAY